MQYNSDNKMKKEQDALATVVRMRQNYNKKHSSAPFLMVLLLSCVPAIAYQHGLLPKFDVPAATAKAVTVSANTTGEKKAVEAKPNHHSRRHHAR